MTKDNRKNYFMGVSPGEWLMVGIMAFDERYAAPANNWIRVKRVKERK